MRKILFCLIASLAINASPAAHAQQQLPMSAAETELAAVDIQQKELVAQADVDRLALISTQDLTINAPTDRVLSHDKFFGMMRSGQIGAEAFERTVEHVVIHGDVGVVMGREIFTPTAASELGHIYGARPLDRRYTNVYVRDGGRWKWFARHANVVSGSLKKVR